MVEYTAGYVSEMEREDGRRFTLKAGMSHQVADNAEPHPSRSVQGARLFIVD